MEALNDPGVTDNLRDGLPKPYTEADALEYIIASQEEGAYAFAITEDGAAVGSIQLSRQGEYPQPHGGAWLLCRPAAAGGAGIGSEALRLACRFAFEQTDLVRIIRRAPSLKTPPRDGRLRKTALPSRASCGRTP